MADNKGNSAVPAAPHDRVAMLSLKADGTPDQTNPEIIGDREFAEAATREQFAQQAVSAVDDVKRRELFGTGGGETVEQDPKIDELKAAHDKAAGAAEKAADAAVEGLFTDDKPAATSTSTTTATATRRTDGGSTPR